MTPLSFHANRIMHIVTQFMRALLAATDDAPLSDFRVIVTGGDSAAKRGKEEAETTKGVAIGGEVQQWCRNLGMHFNAGYDRALFTPPYAEIVARSWCHKMQYIYKVAHGSLVHMFTQAEKDAYNPPLDFTARRAAIEARKGCKRRVDELICMFS